MFKHFIIYNTFSSGTKVKYRKDVKQFEVLANQIMNDEDYVGGSMRVIIGIKELKPTTGVV